MRVLGLVLLLFVLVLGFAAVASNDQADGTVSAGQAVAADQGTGSGASSTGGSDRQDVVRDEDNAPVFAKTSGGSSGSVSLTSGDRGLAPKTQGFDVNLDPGDAIVGQSYGFNGHDGGCQVWLIAGPYSGHIQITDGEWFAFTDGGLSAGQERDLLDQVARKQANQGYGCSSGNQHVSRLEG